MATIPPPPVSTMGQTYATYTSPKVTSAIAQLVANQTAMMSQMALLSFAPTHPPVPHIMIPIQQTFTGEPVGRGEGQGGTGGSRGGPRLQAGQRKSWATLICRSNAARRICLPTTPLFGGGIQAPPQPATRHPPNPIEQFNNWNYCYLCRCSTSKMDIHLKYVHQAGVRLGTRLGAHVTTYRSISLLVIHLE